MDEKSLRVWLNVGSVVLMLVLIGSFASVLRAALTAH